MLAARRDCISITCMKFATFSIEPDVCEGVGNRPGKYLCSGSAARPADKPPNRGALELMSMDPMGEPDAAAAAA